MSYAERAEVAHRTNTQRMPHRAPHSDDCRPLRMASPITVRRMATLTIRTDPEVEEALESLTQDGSSRWEAARAAILLAGRAKRRGRLRAEAEELRNDAEDVAASEALAGEMAAVRAW